MSDLKPCPFCGGAALLSPYHKHPSGIAEGSFVVCNDCDAYVQGSDDNDETIKARNTRRADKDDQTIRELVEALVDIKNCESGTIARKIAIETLFTHADRIKETR